MNAMTTGVDAVDAVRGLERGRPMVIVGRPATGKTQVARRIAEFVARGAHRVLFVDLEGGCVDPGLPRLRVATPEPGAVVEEIAALAEGPERPDLLVVDYVQILSRRVVGGNHMDDVMAAMAAASRLTAVIVVAQLSRHDHRCYTASGALPAWIPASATVVVMDATRPGSVSEVRIGA